MPSYYFDTSALLKKYFPEEGASAVIDIVHEPASECFISRLTVTEAQRAFAQLVRDNEISLDEGGHLRAIFYHDLRSRLFRIIQIKTYHHLTAARLFYKYASRRRFPLLRTADAIQLAGALRLREARGLDFFVADDKALCDIANEEHFSVISPKG